MSIEVIKVPRDDEVKDMPPSYGKLDSLHLELLENKARLKSGLPLLPLKTVPGGPKVPVSRENFSATPKKPVPATSVNKQPIKNSGPLDAVKKLFEAAKPKNPAVPPQASINSGGNSAAITKMKEQLALLKGKVANEHQKDKNAQLSAALEKRKNIRDVLGKNSKETPKKLVIDFKNSPEASDNSDDDVSEASDDDVSEASDTSGSDNSEGTLPSDDEMLDDDDIEILGSDDEEPNDADSDDNKNNKNNNKKHDRHKKPTPSSRETVSEPLSDVSDTDGADTLRQTQTTENAETGHENDSNTPGNGADGTDDTGPVINEEEEKEEMRWRFRLLKKQYPAYADKMPDVSEYTDLEEMKRKYNLVVKEVNLDKNINRYRGILALVFSGMEFLATKIIGVDLTGIAENQIGMMDQYDPLLVEIGERPYAQFGSGLPVEIRLLGLILFQTAVFYVCKKMDEQGNFLSMVFRGAAGQPSPGMSTGGSTSQSSTSSRSSKPGPNNPNNQSAAPERKMRGPSIDLEDLKRRTTVTMSGGKSET
jgi:hypothetical protein